MLRTTVGAVLSLFCMAEMLQADEKALPPVVPLVSEPGFSSSPGLSPTAGVARTFPPEIVPTLPDVGPPVMPPSRPVSDLLSDRLSTPFATQTAGGGYQGRSFNQEFDGDFGGIFIRQKVQVGVTLQRQQIGSVVQQQQVGTKTTVIRPPDSQIQTIIITPVFQNVTVPVYGDVPVPVYRDVQTVLAGRYSGIMITDNDSPRPVDRGYFGYSYYDGLASSLNPGFGDTTQNRQLFGFEKTLFDGNVSIGLRMPYVQVAGPFGSGGNAAGDLSVLFKWAMINNRETGDLLSVGMVLTTPTGDVNGVFPDGTPVPHSVLFQPWAGFVHTYGRAYVQGICNVIIPTDSRDVTLLGNSIAIGYNVYQGGGIIPAITPTFETHIRTPLTNRDPNNWIYLQDQVNLTGGVHFNWNRFTFSGAACVPVVGPRPWNIEALANLNYRF